MRNFEIEVVNGGFAAKVASAYQTNFSLLQDRFDYPPHPMESFPLRQAWLREALSLSMGAEKRRVLIDALTRLHRQYGADAEAYNQLERLKHGQALAVVTGQQTGLWCGPLYTIHKAVSTIRLARLAERLLACPVVPVFWLASEDHDYEEVRWAHLLDEEGRIRHYRLADAGPEHAPVAGRPLPRDQGLATNGLPGTVEELIGRLELDWLGQSPQARPAFARETLDWLRAAAEQSQSLAEWTGRLLCSLFSRHGLVLFDPSLPEIRKISGHFLKQAAGEISRIRAALLQGNRSLRSRGFPLQVEKEEDHLHIFRYDLEGNRRPLFQHEQSQSELLREMELFPERFSPDVLLRPIVQDEWLPTLAYVAGPGELGYYAQMRELYQVFGRKMPVIVPRLAATLLRPEEARLWQIWRPWIDGEGPTLERIVRAYLHHLDEARHGLVSSFGRWKQQRLQANANWLEQLELWDGSAAKRMARILGEENARFQAMFNYVWNRWEAEHQADLQGLRRLYQTLFPEGQEQERYLNVLPYLAEFGRAWLDEWIVSEDTPEENVHGQHLFLKLRPVRTPSS